jgi:hypothetical protein
MKRIHPLTVAAIVIALDAGATIASFASADLLTARQALPIPHPAGTAHSAIMPIVVPAEAVDPTAAYFVRMAERVNGSQVRP